MVGRTFGASVAALVCVLAVIVGACAGADAGGDVAAVAEQPMDAVAEQPVAAGVVLIAAEPGFAGSDSGTERSDSAGAESGEGPVRLLTEPIPPCVPLEGVDHDPCGPDVPPGLGVTPLHVPISWDPPTIAEIMEGLDPDWVTHIVVRATVRPGSTRCDGYLYDPFDYIHTGDFGELRAYWCFVDVRVNDYIVGAGPTELTVGVDRNLFSELKDHTWEHNRDFVIREEFNNPAARVEAAYEGREVVLFLNPTETITVEAWSVAGHYDLFFVMEDTESGSGQSRSETSGTSASEPRYRAVSRERSGDTITDITLDELVTSVKAAAATRTPSTSTTSTFATSTSTTGTSSQSRSESSTSTTAGPTTTTTAPTDRPPYLVTRADQLRAFYIADGAIYEGENATTVLPPPPPVPPGQPTNIDKTLKDGRILLTWDPPTQGGPVNEYRLWFLPVVADETTDSFYDIPSWQAERSIEITNLVRYLGPSFTVQIRAGNQHGYSPWTQKQTFTSTSSTTTTTSTTTTATSSTTTAA